MPQDYLSPSGSIARPMAVTRQAPAEMQKTNGPSPAPKRHKMAVLTWFVVYPMITLLLTVLDPLLGALPMPLRTLMLTLIMVPAMVYVAMPLVTARFAAWLNDTSPLTVRHEGKTNV